MSAVPAGDELHLIFTMLSDWHFGTGAGIPGSLDRVTIRDADGLPFVPAKSVMGVWRDACETLAYGLDGGTEGRWDNWLLALFGSEPSRHIGGGAVEPRPALLTVGSAALPESLASRLRGDDPKIVALRQALTFVKPGVRIDPQSGRAQDEHLRFVEVGRAGAVFVATAGLVPDAGFSAEQHRLALAFLTAGAGLIQRIGAGRRRGLGACRATVAQLKVGNAVATLCAAMASGSPVEPPTWPRPVTRGIFAGLATTLTSAPLVSVPLTLQLREPVIAEAGVLGNVVQSRDYIPGGYLLAALARRLDEVLAQADTTVEALVGQGSLRFLHATIEVAGKVGRPLPMALRFAKECDDPDHIGPAWNVLDETDRVAHEKDGWQTVLLKDAYVGCAAGGTVAAIPDAAVGIPMVTSTHNTVDNLLQRPIGTDEGGAGPGVYVYQAIGTPGPFRSELRLTRQVADRLPPGWWRRLDGPLRLGRSRKAGFGRAELTAGEPVEIGSGSVPISAGAITLWLLSDTLVRGQSLDPKATISRLAATLAADCRARGVAVTEATAKRWQARTTRIESWHVGWGLPRPTLVLLAAGSCVKVAIAGGPGLGRALRQIEAEGLGERRAEGFGHVAIDDPLVTGPVRCMTAGTRVTITGGFVSGKGLVPTDSVLPQIEWQEYARDIERAAWRQEIERQTERLALDAGFRRDALGFEPEIGERAEAKPSASQVGALRAVLQDVEGPNDLSALSHWLDALEATPERRNAWPDRAREILRHLANAPEATLWDSLISGGDWPCLLPDSRQRLRRELWAEALRSLYGRSIRAHQRAEQDAREHRERAD